MWTAEAAKLKALDDIAKREAERQRLEGIRYGHEFDGRTRACVHCGMQRVEYDAMTADERFAIRPICSSVKPENVCTYRPQWKKHQVELMRKNGFATIHAEMSCNTIESMAAMLEECRVHALSSGNVSLLDKLERYLDDYKANPDIGQVAQEISAT